MARSAPLTRSRQASLDAARWLPTYAWWPHPSDFEVNVVVSTFQAATDDDARFEFTLRGYAGSPEPLWEHRLGRLAFGDQAVVSLAALGLPEPPAEGGILELHAVRLDRDPDSAPFLGMWVDAHAPNGGGYIIPTTPIRGSTKRMARDNVQVFPGVVVGRSYDTDIVLLNPITQATTGTIVVASPDGLTSHSDEFVIEPWAAWRAPLGRTVRRAGRLLEASGGVGSATVETSHKVLAFFGPRAPDGTITALDHGAPLFA